MHPDFKSDRELDVVEGPQYPPSLVEIDPALERVVDGHAHSEEEKRIWLKVLRRKEYGVDKLNDDPVLALLVTCFPSLRRLALQMLSHLPYLERMIGRCAARESPSISTARHCVNCKI